MELLKTLSLIADKEGFLKRFFATADVSTELKILSPVSSEKQFYRGRKLL